MRFCRGYAKPHLLNPQKFGFAQDDTLTEVRFLIHKADVQYTPLQVCAYLSNIATVHAILLSVRKRGRGSRFLRKLFCCQRTKVKALASMEQRTAPDKPLKNTRACVSGV